MSTCLFILSAVTITKATQIEDFDDKYVGEPLCIQSVYHSYVRISPRGIVANPFHCCAWEFFRILSHQNGYLLTPCKYYQYLLSAAPNDSVIATKNITQNEIFDIEFVNNQSINTIFIKSRNNKYLRAVNGTTEIILKQSVFPDSAGSSEQNEFHFMVEEIAEHFTAKFDKMARAQYQNLSSIIINREKQIDQIRKEQNATLKMILQQINKLESNKNGWFYAAICVAVICGFLLISIFWNKCLSVYYRKSIAAHKNNMNLNMMRNDQKKRFFNFGISTITPTDNGEIVDDDDDDETNQSEKKLSDQLFAVDHNEGKPTYNET